MSDAPLKDVLNYAEMTIAEGISLQRGMNFRPAGKDYSIFLMSVNETAPYADGFDNEGKVLTYEGHDITKREQERSKGYDQPLFTKNGKLTENGKFFQAAQDYKLKRRVNPERIRVYEKITNNVWSDKGYFYLVDADYISSDSEQRKVFKFKLVPEELHLSNHAIEEELELSRRIPTEVKRIVFERDKGRCAVCGSLQDLHFDHILPYSRGGTSTNAANIQLLCQKHNLQKSNKII